MAVLHGFIPHIYEIPSKKPSLDILVKLLGLHFELFSLVSATVASILYRVSGRCRTGNTGVVSSRQGTSSDCSMAGDCTIAVQGAGRQGLLNLLDTVAR